jgi:hypothetical protein
MAIAPFVGVDHYNRMLVERPHILGQLIFELSHPPATQDVIHQVLTEDEIGLVASTVVLRVEMRVLLQLASASTTLGQKGLSTAVWAVHCGRGRQ